MIFLTPAAVFATGNQAAAIGTALVGVVLAQFALARSKGGERPLRRTSIWAMTLNFVMIPVWIAVISPTYSPMGGNAVGDATIRAMRVDHFVQNSVGEAAVLGAPDPGLASVGWVAAGT